MLDIIEIDAASNTWVEDVRELIERARFEPNQWKYKIYIIDEVHMLSTPAFNALLKTLEEPPSHVKFILATTEIDKVPETIRSRTLRFDFRKIGQSDIVKLLEDVAKKEWIIVEKEVLGIIAKSARWGLRDALTLLEQNVIDAEITTEHVRHTLSLLEDEFIDTIIRNLEHHNSTEILAILDQIREQHIQVRSFFEQLMYRLRDLMVEHIGDDFFYVYHNLFSPIQDAYTKIRNIPDGMMLIEITLLKIAKWEKEESIIENKIEEIQKLQTPKVEKKKVKTEVAHEMIISAPQESQKTPIIETPLWKSAQEWQKLQVVEVPLIVHDKDMWIKPFSFPAFITGLKTTTLMTDVKCARFELGENTDEKRKSLHLIFSKKWNYDRVNTAKSKNILSESLQHIFGGSWSIECTLDIGSENALKNAVNEVF